MATKLTSTQTVLDAITRSVVTSVTKTPITQPVVLPKIGSTGFVAPTPVPVPPELQAPYLAWRSNLEKKTFAGGVVGMTADPELWRRFNDARRRIQLLIEDTGVSLVAGIVEAVGAWWQHWDADGAAAFDSQVTPGAPPRYGTIYARQFVRAPTPIIEFVRLQVQRFGATDAVNRQPSTADLERVTGIALVRALASTPGAGGGGMQSETTRDCGRVPTCPDGSCALLLLPKPADAPTAWLCPGSVYVDSEGVVVPSGAPLVNGNGGGQILYTPPELPTAGIFGDLLRPRNLLIGGGVVLALYLIFRKR